MSLRFHVMSYLLGMLTALVLVGSSVYLLRRPDPPPIRLQLPPTPSPTATPLPAPTPAPLVVFVSGAVQQPGVYTLAPSARVGDAIVAAGGLQANANPALVNQAQLLYDGAQVHVPPPGVPGAEDQPASGQPPAGLSGVLPAPLHASSPADPVVERGDLVNINTATAEQLDALPGIGLSRAQAIIEGRPYQAVADLDRVTGIGAATLERLQPLVTVGP